MEFVRNLLWKTVVAEVDSHTWLICRERLVSIVCSVNNSTVFFIQGSAAERKDVGEWVVFGVEPRPQMHYGRTKSLKVSLDLIDRS